MNLRLPIYGKKTLRLAVEFGIVLSETAREMNRELTQATSIRAEEAFLNELKTNGLEKTALNFVPLVLAVLEV